MVHHVCTCMFHGGGVDQTVRARYVALQVSGYIVDYCLLLFGGAWDELKCLIGPHLFGFCPCIYWVGIVWEQFHLCTPDVDA